MGEQPHVGKAGKLLRRDADEVVKTVADEARHGRDADTGADSGEHVGLRGATHHHAGVAGDAVAPAAELGIRRLSAKPTTL